MAGFTVGTILATLDLDRDPFQATWDPLVEEVHEFVDDPHTVTLDLDAAEANAGLDEDREKVDSLTGRPYSLKVTLEDAEAAASLDALDAKAEEATAGDHSLRFTADTAEASAAAELLQANAEQVSDHGYSLRFTADTAEADAGMAELATQAEVTDAALSAVDDRSVAARASLDDLSVAAAGAGEDVGLAGAALSRFASGAGEAQVATDAVRDSTEALGRTVRADAQWLDGSVYQGAQKWAAGLEDLWTESTKADDGLTSLVKSAQDVKDALTDMGIVTQGLRGGLYDLEGRSISLNTVLARLGTSLRTLVEKPWTNFDAIMDEGQSKLEEVGASAGGAGGDIDRLGKAAADAAGGGGGMGMLLTTALTLGPALVSIGGVGVGAALSLGAAFLTVASGVGAFALAASSDLGIVETAVKKSFHSWDEGLQEEVLPVVNQIPGIVSGVLDDLTPLVQGTSNALDVVASSIRSDLNSPDLRQFVQWLGTEAPTALNTLNETIQGFGAGLSKMGEVATPVINEIEHGMASLGHDLTRFSTSSEFRHFITWLLAEGPQVRTTLDNIGGDLGKLAADAAPVGHDILDVVNAITGLTGSVLGFAPQLGSLGIAAVVAGVAFSKLSGPISSAVTWITKFGGASAVAEGGLSGLMDGLVAMGPEILAGGAALAALAVAFHVIDDSAQDVDKTVTRFISRYQNIPVSNWKDIEEAIQETGKATETATAKLQKMNHNSSILSLATQAVHLFTTANAKAADALTEEGMKVGALHQQYVQMGKDVDELAKKYDLSTTEVAELAQKAGITLKKALTRAEINEFGSALQALGALFGGSTAGLEEFAARVHGTITKIATEIATAGSKATAAFKASFTLAQAFSGQAAVAQSSISQWYQTSLTQAQSFANNVQTALKAGYNPNFIAQLIEAGPQQAGPILGSLVSTTSSSFVDMVNAAQSSLNKIGQQTVDESKLMQIAIKSSSAQTTADYTHAVAMWVEITANGGHATVQGLATQLGIGEATVRRVLTEYAAIFKGKITTASTAGGQAGAAYSKGVASKKGTVEQSANDTFISPTKGILSKADWTSTGKHSGQTYGDGLRGAQTDAAGAAKSIADAVKKALTATDREVGTKIDSDVAAGLRSGSVTVTAAGKSVAQDALAAMKATARSVGEAIDQGVAAGIRDGSSSVDAAAATMAKGAVAAAKASVKSTSPSQLAREEVGQPIGQGVWLGMLDELGNVESAAVRLATAGIPTAPRAAAFEYGAMVGSGAAAQIGGTGAGVHLHIVHAERIQGGADPETVRQWKALQAQHDERLVQLVEAINP